MLTTSQNQAIDIQSLQDIAAIRDTAKCHALQLRQEAMNAFFKTILAAVIAATRRITARGVTTSQIRMLES